ncbi:hypothetical protein OH76DRAFT_696785 [Lentinus brumalis]|uniref:Uncharacterized protein n=1 Tax=Lentinus brumalis TaxID=2498619 RepID=A0A371D696_9APHY|nr:hypothetical protein OH76DRAFT_696785 [Polyporus brumalis]
MRPPSTTGLFVFHDTGPPRGSRDYTTLVIVHGHSWHSGVFASLLPHARHTNTRIILVNRRDYPGTEPYTASELALLPLSVHTLTRDPEELEGIKISISFFMKHRGHELLRFLAGVVRDGDIPLGDVGRNAGGIVLVGWSLGMLWCTALLAHVASFQHDDVNLSRYLRRIVLYDAPTFLFGYPRPHRAFNPFLDPSHSTDIDAEEPHDWVSGYYTHGSTLETLALRTPARDRLPTIERMTIGQRTSCLYFPPGEEGGSDQLLMIGGHRAGVFGDLWQAALALAPIGNGNGNRNDLRDVEVRVMWCDRSVWETTHAAWCVAAELEDAREKGRLVRDVQLARVRGANHFVSTVILVRRGWR